MLANKKKNICEFFELKKEKELESKRHAPLTLEMLRRIRELRPKIGTVDLLEQIDKMTINDIFKTRAEREKRLREILVKAKIEAVEKELKKMYRASELYVRR